MISEKFYIKAESVQQAISAAKENELNFRYLAGGTDVLVNKYQGNDNSDCLIDISALDELKQITEHKGVVKIGSLVKLDELQKHSVLKENFPTLLEAAHAVASPMLRKTATIGGNILCENRCSYYNQSEWWRESVGYCLKCDGDVCIATGGSKACFSKFVSDTAPVLIACNAQVEVIDAHEEKCVPLETIYTGDGLHPKNISALAIIKAILLHTDKKYKCTFKKLRPREAVDFTSLTTAVSVSSDNKIRIVVGGVDPKPILIEGSIADSKQELIAKAVKKCRIVDNDIYSRQYRKEMIGVFLEESF